MQDEAGAPLIAAHDETTPPEQTTDTSAHQRSRLFAVLGGTAAVVLLLDQLSKLWALRSLTPGDPVDLVGSLIRLNLIRNPGAAFSIGTAAPLVVSAASDPSETGRPRPMAAVSCAVSASAAAFVNTM